MDPGTGVNGGEMTGGVGRKRFFTTEVSEDAVFDRLRLCERGRLLAGEVTRTAWWLRAPSPRTISP